jgi:uncharacterized tellurite resistance protein B-like protein
MPTATMIRSAALSETHGLPEMPRDAFMAVAKAFKVVLAADGVLHPKELQAYRDACRTYGATDELLQELEAFDPMGASIAQVFDGMDLSRIPARGRLYDVIKAARADGDDAVAEQTAVREAARVLGVSDDVVDLLRGLVDEEEQLRARRLQALATPAFS